MNYQQALRIGGVDLNNKARGGATDKTIAAMRASALFRGVRGNALATRITIAGVKRRVAKRWSTRLIREGLPRAARLTGPKSGSSLAYQAQRRGSKRCAGSTGGRSG